MKITVPKKLLIKYALGFVACLIAVQILTFAFVTHLPSRDFPSQMYAESCAKFNYDGGCGCTQKNVKAVGVPFRANLYDVCRQDDSINATIFTADLIIQAFAILAAYLVITNLIHLVKT